MRYVECGMRNPEPPQPRATPATSAPDSAFRVPHSALSIVVPSHARPDLLTLCLASVARFAPPGTEVIVVDDGSGGGCVSRAAGAFPGVTVVRRPKAGGFC